MIVVVTTVLARTWPDSRRRGREWLSPAAALMSGWG
jgi:hypothetical protein